MSKLTIEIEADDFDGEAHTPTITLSYNGQKLGLLQYIHFRATTGDPFPILHLYGIDRAALQEAIQPVPLSEAADLNELKKVWPWIRVGLKNPASNEVRELP